jgi:tRNA-splicing ligase RtcB
MGVKGKDLAKLGWPPGPVYKVALDAAGQARRAGRSKSTILEELEKVHADPDAWREDPLYGPVAARILADRQSRLDAALAERENHRLRTEGKTFGAALNDDPAPCSTWGADGIDDAARKQMAIACRLPVAVRGAQMPDGHVGYGLPIGGVLATEGAVIPYGVGVDIACRMKLSILPDAADRIPGWRDRLKNALRAETRFGIGAAFDDRNRREHAVMDDPAWQDLPPALARLKDKAWSQLGTSGSGNHFVEWGELLLERPELGLPPGRYLALLSHSGSRGFGGQVANYFTRLAMDLCKLPNEARHLAWLDLDKEAGALYWLAMNLAGRYASANHAMIHRHVLGAVGLEPAAQIENHHNFAWLEVHGGRELVVHRKGATPAAKGELGIIPGSMGDPGFVVRGRGKVESLNSAAHGAGRRMSRSAAKKSITGHEQRKYLEERGIELLDGGLDEAPQAYKNIHEVMAAQSDLVEPLAAFYPKIVLMAAGGKAED